MKDLLHSVRQRYETGMNFHNLFTLSHRIRRQPPTKPNLKLETVELERGILRAANSEMLRHIEQLKQQTTRTDKQRLEADKRVKRQSSLFFSNINIQIKRLKRELESLKALEKERREDSGLAKEAITSVASRSAKRLIDEHTDISSVEMHSEISGIAKKTVRNALQKMREEQEYERRRGG